MDDYFTRLPRDIILTYILPCLEGETLITLSSWPSLLYYGPVTLSALISMFPGGYRSFFSDAFPSIHHRNIPPPPPPPKAYFTYAIDLFLHGEREPLYTEIEYQPINIKTYPRHAPWWISTVGSDAYFQIHAYTINERGVVALYETVMPGLYDELVKFQFYVRCIDLRMEDMNGKHLKEEYAAKVLLNAIENGERKKK
ncbi:hypothetical protein TSUD_359150 [Trifolium subterraneum]|uniref:Uncharacterized protein n=1 Tax=Trifolium subterraneum TaxID=3900 RepID=A0A2Z6N730_TRISU|nr:hypothetical protein TSUD_359150 [Trifolium subterraneum]